MKNVLASFCILVGASLLSACGFSPLYAEHSDSAGKISVAQIDGRGGHALRSELVPQLAAGLPGLDGPATLTVTLKESIGRLSLARDGSTTRSDSRVTARYVLAFADDAISGRVKVSSSFQASGSAYSDITDQANSSERAMLLVSRQLIDDMRLKLANRQ